MPKLKTRKCVAKRVKKTGTGKFLRKHAGVRHLNAHKSSRRKRRLGRSEVVHEADLNRVRFSLPYA
jgi:large subunit ribosomal protein L35